MKKIMIIMLSLIIAGAFSIAHAGSEAETGSNWTIYDIQFDHDVGDLMFGIDRSGKREWCR